MAEQYRHRVWCVTEGAHVEESTFSTTAPTQCPNDAGHTIDSAKTAVVEVQSTPHHLEFTFAGKTDPLVETSSSTYKEMRTIIWGGSDAQGVPGRVADGGP